MKVGVRKIPLKRVLPSIPSLNQITARLGMTAVVMGVQQATALCDFFQMPANAGKSGSTLSGEFWGGQLDGVSGTLGFFLERRVSLMLVTMLIFAVGVHRTLSRCLLGGWAFGLASRREALASLDVSHTAATSLLPSRRCRLNGSLLDELLLVTGLAPELETQNFKGRNPSKHSAATDASPSGAGGCVAPITQVAWLALYDVAQEKGEHVRLEWKGEEPPSNVHDGRASAAPLALKLHRATMCSYRFFAGKHINLLELESLISLLAIPPETNSNDFGRFLE